MLLTRQVLLRKYLQKRTILTEAPKTVVIALGGNALLRDGEKCGQEVQDKNIAIAAKG
jgi:hypothetical protein